MKVEILTDDSYILSRCNQEKMLLVNVCDQSRDEPSRQQFIKVLIRKWLVASLGTDGSCVLYESGPPFSIHDSQ